MATITVNVADITGESAVVADHIDAFAISDFINSNGGGAASEVSELQLHRYRDRASPHLAHACAAGTNLGEVEITLHVNGDDGLEPFYKCSLTQTYVSRIEHQTLDSSGNALKRHYGFSGGASETNYWGQALGNDERSVARHRAHARPHNAESPGTYTDDEIERIWLSGEVVTWTFVDGNIATVWDIKQGRVPA